MKQALIALWIFLGLLVLLILGFGFISNSVKQATGPKVSLELYSEVVTERQSRSGLYAFLPAEIPAEMEDAAFYHIPRFLQGGDVICLRMTLPEVSVKKLLDELEASGRDEAKISDVYRFSSYCYPEYGIEETSGEQLFDNVSRLPSGFRVYLYKSDLDDIEENWNHNFLAFTAISLEKREVVYHTNRW